MSKKTTFVCAYLKVTVCKPWRSGLPKRRWHDAARNLADAIRRHCDEVEDIEIIYETEDTCEHCGYAWTEGDAAHNGGCCDADAAVLARVDAEREAS